MATTSPRTSTSRARWRFAQAVSLTLATLAGLFLIQLAAASRDLPAEAPRPDAAPAKVAARATSTTRPARSSSREAKAAMHPTTHPTAPAPVLMATRPPASRPTASALRPARDEKSWNDEVDESDVLLASDRIPKSAVVPAPQGRELLHDIRPPAASATASTPLTAPAVAATGPASEPRKHSGRVLRVQATAYCPCPKCCGSKAEGVTASGLPITYNGGAFAAADTSILHFGTRLIIPGYAAGRPVEVIDRGGAIKGMRVDVFFPTHEQAKAWGRRWVNVTVVE